jgi:ankyrin repeat protein
MKRWLRWAYEGNAWERRQAVAKLREEPAKFGGDPWLACAVGDQAAVEAAISADAAWVNRPGGPLRMPPLVAVTHSMLILEPGFEAGLLACAALLLRNGADPDSTFTDTRYPDWPLSALYGAAGKTHHAGMTRLLLEAGPNLDDNESLYHSVEARDSTCTRLLLAAGAKVVGNTLGRAMDCGKLDDMRLMLELGGDPRAGTPLHHAILRGRSMEYVQALVDAGADLRAVNKDGVSLFRWAERFGRTDVVEMLRAAGIEETLSTEEAFVAACARGDETAARELLAGVPDMFGRLSERQLQALPELADVGNLAGVRTMLALGWPLEEKAAWQATALHIAVYRGDPATAEVLLRAGADWRTLHGFNDNTLGALAYASQSESIEDPAAPRDFAGCARVLVENGVPVAAMAGYGFSPEVEEYFGSLA